MPVTSDFTQAQLDALTAAIAQGATSVEYNGRRVQYASLADMIKLRDRMMRELNSVGVGIARPNARPSVFAR